MPGNLGKRRVQANKSSNPKPRSEDAAAAKQAHDQLALNLFLKGRLQDFHKSFGVVRVWGPLDHPKSIHGSGVLRLVSFRAQNPTAQHLLGYSPFHNRDYNRGGGGYYNPYSGLLVQGGASQFIRVLRERPESEDAKPLKPFNPFKPLRPFQPLKP